MAIKVSFSDSQLPKKGVVIFVVYEGKVLGQSALDHDKKLDGLMAGALDNANRFKGKKGEVLTLTSPANSTLSHIVLLGLGEAAKLDGLAARDIGAGLVGLLNGLGEKSALLVADRADAVPLTAEALAAELGLGALLRSYRFDKYRTTEKPEDKPSFERLAVATSAAKEALALFTKLERVADGVFLTRDLISEPPNVIYPATLADAARNQLTELGVEVEVLGEAEMQKLGLNTLLAVGQGSAKESKLVIMKYYGQGKGKATDPVVLVGKGVTFDSGGISLKPGDGMWDMKYDMGGSAAVVGTMKALAGRKAKATVFGVIACVENMPDGNATRPADIVKSLSGQTVEILNTDAEGRLILADALWYAQDKFKPKVVVDLATLTGAIVVALGTHFAGLFSNDDNLAEQLLAAGKTSGEKLWRMPVDAAYEKEIESDIADIKNISGGRGGGSSTAAAFLKKFIKPDTIWAHLDIAAVAWATKDQGVTPKGAAGFGVRLLDQWIADHHES
jgi:leucyl aminopeptidase